MTELPNPLTPPDCDLSGYTWMPLDVVRVIDSDTFGLSTGDEFKTAFRLWAKSWLQVPAASLPDDDRLLAHLAGLSENMAKWKKVRAVALRGFIKCSDGRLYHPVIATKAIEAMGKREAREEREENEQTRQERYRLRRKALFETLRAYGIVPDAKTKMDELERLVASHCVTDETPSVTKGVTGETHGDVTNDAPATANTGHERTGQDITENPSGSTRTSATSSRACATPAQLSAAMRRHSIDSQPGNPKIIAAAEAGVTVETVEAACAEAKSKKQGERVNAGYVISIAEAWTREAAAPRANGTGRPQTYHDERADVIATLTGRKAAHQPDADGVIDVDHHAVPRLG